MNKLASALLLGLLAGPTAFGQDRSRIYTEPAVPPSETLDRLNLKLGWRVYLPMESRQDGIFSVQIPDRLKPPGQQVFVQTRSGAVIALDGTNGVTRWRARLGVPYRVTQALGYNSHSVFVINGVDLYSLSRETGELQWQFSMPNAPSAPPVADEERIYLTLGTGRLYAYDFPKPDQAPAPSEPGRDQEKRPEDKDRRPDVLPEPSPRTPAEPAQRMQAQEPHRYARISRSGPAIQSISAVSSGNRTVQSVSAVSSGNRRVESVSAVSARNRTLRAIGALVNPYEASSIGTSGPQPVMLWDYLATTRLELPPLITTNFLLVPGSDGTFQAMSKFDGHTSYQFEAGAALSAPLGQHNEIAFVASEDNGVYALDIVGGRILWRFLGSGPILIQPAVNDDNVFVYSLRAGLYCLDRETGRTLWRNTLAVRFLSANKKFVYALDSSGRLLVLDRARGTELSVYDGARDFVFPVANEITDRVFLGANHGLLVCLHDREYTTPLTMKTVEALKSETSLAEARKPADKKPLEKKPPKAKPKPDKGDADDKMPEK